MLQISNPTDRPVIAEQLLAALPEVGSLRTWSDRGNPDYERIGLATIGQLGPYLDTAMIDRYMTALGTIRGAWSRSRAGPGDIGYKSLCQAESGLARYANARARISTVQHGLRLVEKIRDDRVRELTAAALATCVEKETIADWTTTVRKLPSLRRAEAYEQLAVRLCELGDTAQAFDVAVGIESPEPRRRAFRAVGPSVAGLPHDELHEMWTATDSSGGLVHRLAVRSRPMLLGDIAALTPAIVAIGGSKARAETAKAIRDVTEWWQ